MPPPTNYDHIVLISLDTMRSDCIAANPCNLWQKKYAIPSAFLKDHILNAIAREGFFFSNCIAAAPYTSASHASFFTGQWPLHHGVYEFFNKGLKSKTIFHYARRQGYTTNFKTDFPIILGRYLGFHHDIDNYIIEDDDAALASLKNGSKTFNFIHFGGLHIPYGFHNLRYGGQDYIDTIEYHEKNIATSENNLADKLVETYRSDEDLSLLLRYKKIIQHYYTQQDYRQLFTLYLQGANYFFEKRFRPFFQKLKEICAGKRTLMVIFGDHGEEYDEHSYGHHNSLAEGVIRVPLIFMANDIAPGADHNRVRSIDVAPTVLQLMGYDLAGIPLDGHSLLPIMQERKMPVFQRPALSQAYTSETEEFVNFQQRLLRTQKKTGTLRHYLYKEAAYLENCKLHRQHFAYMQNGGIWGMQKIEARTVLEIFNEHHWPAAVEDSSYLPALEAMLAEYNSIKSPKQKTVNPTQEIRDQLRAMGYNV